MTHIAAYGFYMLRRAALPVVTLETLHDQENYAHLNTQLRQLFSDPSRQESIYIASPEFYQRFIGWLEGRQTDDADKIAQTLYKYLARMCTRCTPYGLFAGCATGTLADQTEIRFDSQSKHQKFARLDMEFLTELVESILISDEMAPLLRYVPNKMLYEVDNKYRYTERVTDDNQQSFRISSVETSDLIDGVLKIAHGGATRLTLAESLLTLGAVLDEALHFIDELIDVQILVPDLSPTLTGDDFRVKFMERMEQDYPAHTQVPAVLRQVGALLARQDSHVEKYEQIAALIHTIAPTRSQNRVQVDLFYNTTVNTLGHKPTNRITQQLEKLMVLARRQESRDFRSFRQRFADRYEQQEVPLHIALDNELGVGYNAAQQDIGFQPLLDDMVWPEEGSRQSVTWGVLQTFVCQKYVEAIETHRSVITLTDADLTALRQETAAVPLPTSFYAFGNLLAASEQAIDANDFQFNLIGCAGPSSASLLGRFCPGDPHLADWVTKALADEERHYPDAVLAEVIHLPETRVGNVLRRPVLRRYEIPYLTDAGVDEPHQLPISDLRVSVHHSGRIMLRSVKLNKEVIPRLTTAHNFSTGLPIYRFLCDLQYQDAGFSLSWDWGLLNNQAYLPRVQYGNIIVSRATWTITQPAAKASAAELTRLLADLKTRYHLPQYVIIIQGDNELLIDTQSRISLELLLTEYSKRDRLVLKEYLFTAGNRFLTDELGSYANELVLPLKSSGTPWHSVPLPTDLSGQVQRKFPLGSEWLFVKIYAGEKVTETILSLFIKPLVQQLTDEGLIDKWFFIRYADPEPHLRLRFHGIPSQQFFLRIIDYMNTISQAYVQNHVITRIQYDTYNREVERYGEKTIADSEDLFCYDSEAILAMIEQFSIDDDAEQHRWLVALRGVDELLNDAGYAMAEKLQLLDRLQESFLTEFGDTPDLKRQLNQKYRTATALIKSAMKPAPSDTLPAFFLDVLLRRSQQQAPLLAKLRVAHGEATLAALLPSFIHMHLNRLFFTNQRSHELVIYHFLRKYYASAVARSKPKP